MDPIGHGFGHALQKPPSHLYVRPLDQSDHGDFARAVDADEQERISCGNLPLGDVGLSGAGWTIAGHGDKRSAIVRQQNVSLKRGDVRFAGLREDSRTGLLCVGPEIIDRLSLRHVATVSDYPDLPAVHRERSLRSFGGQAIGPVAGQPSLWLL